MTSNTAPHWRTIGAFSIFALSCLIALIIRLSVCLSKDYTFVDRYELADPDEEEASRQEEGTARQGVYFPGLGNHDERLVLYSYRYGCLQLERWRPSAQGNWIRDQFEGARMIWAKFGSDLELVEQWECSTQSEVLPRPRAISPKGTKLAWIWHSVEDGSDGRYFLQVASVGDIHSRDFKPESAVTPNVVPVPPPYHDLIFIDEERLLLWHGQDRVLTWDTKREARIADDPLVKGAVALKARDGLIASANFQERVGGLTILGSGLVHGKRVLQLFESGELDQQAYHGSALALGTNGLVALASTKGTFVILGLKGPDETIMISERPLSEFDLPIVQATWIDDTTVAFAGDFAALHIARLSFANDGQSVSLDDVYPLALQEIPNGMQWMSVDPLTNLLVYGTDEGAFVGNLLPRCERIGWEIITAIPVGVAGVLSFLWSLLSTGEKIKHKRQSKSDFGGNVPQRPPELPSVPGVDPVHPPISNEPEQDVAHPLPADRLPPADR